MAVAEQIGHWAKLNGLVVHMKGVDVNSILWTVTASRFISNVVVSFYAILWFVCRSCTAAELVAAATNNDD